MAVLETKNGAVDFIEYDLSRITARQMQAFFAAVKDNDMQVMAATFTQVVKRLPGGREPGKVETYLDMPFYGEFQDILEGMVAAAKNARAR